ncbi:reverse transcriptase domain-containing protein [Tanacetum coccineum]
MEAERGVTDDALRLYLFPYSLMHHATTWFDHLPKNSIHTFQEMASKFLSKYFPLLCVTKLRHRDTINAAAGGTFMKRRPEEFYHLIENMTAHHNDWDTSAHRVVLLKKLPEKLGDPRKFLIPCDFQELEKCMALANLGTNSNLMPLSVWKTLMLPELVPIRMTLELANRSLAYPTGIAEDVFVQVGKFTFPADFVVVDYDVDPRVPLILGRPFLRTARALVDVHGEELILRDGNEKLIFHAHSTSKHPHKHGNDSINMINFIDITYEDHFLEVLKFKKSNHPSSGSTTPIFDSFPSLTPFKTTDLREIGYLLNRDPSTESSPKYDIEIIDPILERFTDKSALIYSPLQGDSDDDDDDLFDLKSDNDEWKKLLYGDSYNDTPSENDKSKDSNIKSLIDELDLLNRLCYFLSYSIVTPDKSLTLEESNILSHSSDHSSDRDPLFFLESTVTETLLSFF